MRLLEVAAALAFEKAQRTPVKQFWLAAVSKRSDGALVVAPNNTLQSPSPSQHAEARVLRKSDYGSTLYVARVTHDGRWAISKPCSSCQSLIRSKRVKKVIYTLGVNEYGIWYPEKDTWYTIKRTK